MNTISEAAPTTQKQRLVYLIDDESIRRTIARLSKSVKLRVETFSSVDEFLAGPRQAKDCCILVDIGMPGMTAPKFRQRLREGGMSIPIIAVARNDDTGAREQARQLGATSFFRKPVDDQALMDAIWWAINRK